MPFGPALDGVRLAYDRLGTPGRAAVVLLHGWPGDRTDQHAVARILADTHDVVMPDLCGFGESDRPPSDDAHGAAAQARGVATLIESLDLHDVVVGGYDVGSRTAQRLAHDRPDLPTALVVTPPTPGVGERMLAPDPMREFWYQGFHQLDLAEQLIDGRADAVRAYLTHFWTHWSGPDWAPEPDRIAHLTARYATPGAFVASIGWYRAGGGAVANAQAETVPDPADRPTLPVTVLWPEHDPLFPRAWSDRLGEFFADVVVEPVDGVGHFVPVEAPERFAAAVAAARR